MPVNHIPTVNVLQNFNVYSNILIKNKFNEIYNKFLLFHFKRIDIPI